MQGCAESTRSQLQPRQAPTRQTDRDERNGSDMQEKDTSQTVSRAHTSGRRLWRWAALPAVLVAVGLGLAACGDESPKGSTNSSSSSGALMADALKFTGCMRSHGLTDFPDPTVGSNGLPSFSINGGPNNSNLNPSSSQFQTAHRACEKDLPNLGGQTPADKAAANAKALKYVQCMRSNGEPDYPDPNGQGVIQMITNATGILDPSSPQFQKAEKACQSLDSGFSGFGAASSGSG
jgi:hypothetical protein